MPESTVFGDIAVGLVGVVAGLRSFGSHRIVFWRYSNSCDSISEVGSPDNCKIIRKKSGEAEHVLLVLHPSRFDNILE